MLLAVGLISGHHVESSAPMVAVFACLWFVYEVAS